MAKLRADLGWTQDRLAERVALSRVALSHIETGLSVPSERTVTLLAGVFGREPYELVAGTTYPPAKAERLPVVAARHTEVAHELALLGAVLDVIDRVPPRARRRLLDDALTEWRPRLAALLHRTGDGEERRRVSAALRRLDAGGQGDIARTAITP